MAYFIGAQSPATRPPVGRRQKITLTMLKSIGQLFLDLLPKRIANAFRQHREQMILNELEVERLDRIRNPSKYRGK